MLTENLRLDGGHLNSSPQLPRRATIVLRPRATALTVSVTYPHPGRTRPTTASSHNVRTVERLAPAG
jgi:hypothetical protein